MSETVERRDIEFDAEDLRDAIEAARDGGSNIIRNNPTIVGSVIVCGDGCHDDDAYVANVEDVTAVYDGNFDADECAYTGTASLYEQAQDALGPDVVEVVEELVNGANTVEKPTFDTYYSVGQADVEVSYEGSVFDESEMIALQDDPRTTIGKIKYTEEDGVFHMAVNVEDEE